MKRKETSVNQNRNWKIILQNLDVKITPGTNYAATLGSSE